MIDRLKKWWSETGKPGVIRTASAWWEDIDQNPGLHFLSMIFGMFVLCAVKFVVWLAA